MTHEQIHCFPHCKRNKEFATQEGLSNKFKSKETRLMARQFVYTELREWANLQMQLHVTVILPMWSHNLHGSVSTKMILDSGSFPLPLSLTLFSTEQLEQKDFLRFLSISWDTQHRLAFEDGRGDGFMDNHGFRGLIKWMQQVLVMIWKLTFVTVNMLKYPEVLFRVWHIYS